MKHKIKINNSYESEPSEPSSCNTSLSNDNNSFERKIMSGVGVEEASTLPVGIPKLSDLLQPTIFKQSIGHYESMNSKKQMKNSMKFQELNLKSKSGQTSNLTLNNSDGYKSRSLPQPKQKLVTSNQQSDFKGFASETSKTSFETLIKDDDNDLKNSPSPNQLFIDEDNTSDCNVSNSLIKETVLDEIRKYSVNERNIEVPPNDGGILKQILLQESDTREDINERSPDLFDFEKTAIITEDKSGISKFCALNESIIGNFEDTTSSFTFKKNDKQNFDDKLLERIKKCLSGVPPPPSVTNFQFDVLGAVVTNKENILNFRNTLKEFISTGNCVDVDEQQEHLESLFKPSHSLEDIRKMSWPKILTVKHHGLHYNVSTVSEKIEVLCMSVAERYVGVETSSSYTSIPQSIKRYSTRSKKKMQSPGSRLSHLAKRRAAFSAATLQLTFQKQVAKSIVIDSKKSENRRKSKIKTPKRRTLGKMSIARKLSSSSTKERLNEQVVKPGPTRETSKRALFQSPPKTKLIASKPVIKPEIANRVEKSKRALFSPVKMENKNPNVKLSTENELKRKRFEEEDDIVIGNHSKIIRSDSENITPRSLKIKSQSFCVGAGTNMNNNDNYLMENLKAKGIFRSNSDTVCSSQLTGSHKKKLLWAVSQALQIKQINGGHPKFKQYASTLARAIKRLYLEFYLHLKTTSTSDTMLKLSKKYVHCVLSDMSADEIYSIEKTRRQEQEKQTGIKKLNGYIAAEEYKNNITNNLKKVPSLIFSENSCDSFNLSNSNTSFTQKSQYSEFSQDSLLSKSYLNLNYGSGSVKKLSQQQQINEIEATATDIASYNIKIPKLPNSSSKNNLYGIALRENVDCEQRKSAQKNFTGKDTKNTSPYVENVRSVANVKYHLNANNSRSPDLNMLKAKRQIFFDC